MLLNGSRCVVYPIGPKSQPANEEQYLNGEQSEVCRAYKVRIFVGPNDTGSIIGIKQIFFLFSPSHGARLACKTHTHGKEFSRENFLQRNTMQTAPVSLEEVPFDRISVGIPTDVIDACGCFGSQDTEVVIVDTRTNYRALFLDVPSMHYRSVCPAVGERGWYCETYRATAIKVSGKARWFVVWGSGASTFSDLL